MNQVKTMFLLVYMSAVVLLGWMAFYYAFYEIKSVGIHVIRKNQFVVVTFLGSVSLLISLSFFVAANFIPNLSNQGRIVLLAVNSVTLSASTICHVALVYLRSKAVFFASPGYTKIMRILMITFYMLACATAFLSIISDALVPPPPEFVYTLEAIALTTAALLGTIDIISTISFGRYVQEVNSNLTKNSYMKHGQSNVAQTDLIARRGVLICFCSTLSVVFYWIYWGLTWGTKDFMLVSAVAKVSDVIYVFQQYSFVVVMILWMYLKMELDGIVHKVHLHTSGDHLLKSNSAALE
eukprot:TRINITY_DN8519_c0_g2_i1.p1 TRINITY_DN8519_c0_g2~~TRINITY_DN8519_c0_g2_i1.p1  ORF type:complete len:295 (+),score=61.83 TRINITY_DN8519_c0_g2_i1:1067-1951(+)